MCRPCQELSDQEDGRPHIPRGQVRGMSLTAEEVGHPMLVERHSGQVGSSAQPLE